MNIEQLQRNKELFEKETELIKLMSEITESEWEVFCTNMSKVGLTANEVQRNVSAFAEAMKLDNKMYLVKCDRGQEIDYMYRAFPVQNIFTTANKETAVKYVERANKILDKWKKYYNQFESEIYSGMKYWHRYDRWLRVNDYHNIRIEEIELR